MSERSTLEQRLDFIEGLLQNADVHGPRYLMAAIALEFRQHTEQVWDDAGRVLADMQEDSKAYQKGLEDGHVKGFAHGSRHDSERILAQVRGILNGAIRPDPLASDHMNLVLALQELLKREEPRLGGPPTN